MQAMSASNGSAVSAQLRLLTRQELAGIHVLCRQEACVGQAEACHPPGSDLSGSSAGVLCSCCRKPVWAKLRHFAQQELAAQLYEPISMEHARQVLQQRRLGVARLRLVPKKTGKGIQKLQQCHQPESRGR